MVFLNWDQKRPQQWEWTLILWWHRIEGKTYEQIVCMCRTDIFIYVHIQLGICFYMNIRLTGTHTNTCAGMFYWRDHLHAQMCSLNFYDPSFFYKNIFLWNKLAHWHQHSCIISFRIFKLYFRSILSTEFINLKHVWTCKYSSLTFPNMR